jgi:hypothetical protein
VKDSCPLSFCKRSQNGVLLFVAPRKRNASRHLTFWHQNRRHQLNATVTEQPPPQPLVPMSGRLLGKQDEKESPWNK